MATVSCATFAGVRSVAQFLKLRAFGAVTLSGAETAAGNVPWAGSGAKRKAVSWIPQAQTPVLDDSGRFTLPWYKFFQEIAQNRLGGIDAPTVPQIVTTQVQTQSQVVDTQALAVQTVANVNQVATAVNANTQVAKAASLPGSDQIPIVPVYSPGDNMHN